MNQNWQYCGRIAVGGGVMSIGANAHGQVWLATGGGVFSTDDDGWRPLRLASVVEQAGAVAAAGRDWWVAGLSGGLFLTWDGGKSWGSAWTDQVSEPFTCLIVSPRYGADLTLLAGTAGAGVLRSTDGGRRWHLSNFGLQEFTVFALATAGDWKRRQVVFAGTADGVYRSSGGGRAWKPVGLAGLAVQCMAAAHKPPQRPAASPDAAAMPDASGDWTVLAGTEADGLYRTLDGGLTWEPCGQQLGAETGINGLLCARTADGDVWLAGTDEGAIWRSVDEGDSWTLVAEIAGPVLVLAEGTDRLLAGTSEDGLWVSTDLGITWQADDALCAWGFRRLYRTVDRQLAALAPVGGVWLSSEAAEGWERVLEASYYEPVLAYSAIDAAWLAARVDGLWRGAPGSEADLVLETADAPVVALTSSAFDGSLWAGTSGSDLWTSADEGISWQMMETPFQGQRLLGLVCSPQDGTPLVGTLDGERNEVNLWRNVEDRWQCWLSRSEAWAGIAIAGAGPHGEASWAALGGKLYAHTDQGWKDLELPGHEGDVAALLGPTPKGRHYIIAGQEVLRCDAEGTWEALTLPNEAADPLDLCLSASDELLCLDGSGQLWSLES